MFTQTGGTKKSLKGSNTRILFVLDMGLLGTHILGTHILLKNSWTVCLHIRV